jgi:hypothetical protein
MTVGENDFLPSVKRALCNRMLICRARCFRLFDNCIHAETPRFLQWWRIQIYIQKVLSDNSGSTDAENSTGYPAIIAARFMYGPLERISTQIDQGRPGFEGRRIAGLIDVN